jgi:hypothetical protein
MYFRKGTNISEKLDNKTRDFIGTRGLRRLTTSNACISARKWKIALTRSSRKNQSLTFLDTSRVALKTTRPIIILLRVYSLPR